jgi:hypothetical protein
MARAARTDALPALFVAAAADARAAVSPPTDMTAAFESLLAAYKTPKREPRAWMRELTATTDFREIIDLVIAGIGQLFRR